MKKPKQEYSTSDLAPFSEAYLRQLKEYASASIEKENVRLEVFASERITCDLQDTTPENFFATLKNYLKNIGLKPLLDGIEEQAKAILISGGYMLSSGQWKKVGLKKLNSMTALEKDAEMVILKIQDVKNCIAQCDAENAALNAIIMANAAFRAKIELMNR
jgi:hypothetical protein